MNIKIILADDHKIMRDGLRNLLESEKNFEIVAEAGDGRTVVKLANELSPDLIVMDTVMPDLNGIEATRKILQEKPDIKIIALSMHSNRQFIVEMLKAGASGYILKDSAFEELIKAIHSIMKDEIFLSPQLNTSMLKDYISGIKKDKSTVFSTLTKREREVLQLIAEGKTTKEVAYLLNVSSKTVETHRQQLMYKLDIHNISGLTKYAIREGITSL